MRLFWPNGLPRIPVPLPYLRANKCHARTMTTTSHPTSVAVGKQSQQQRQKKNAAPTHFLCLPLINSTSLPQLESSLTAFKTAHPPNAAPAAQSNSSEPGEKAPPPAVIPDGSVRPLGTLHLTLGVMNLDSEERLNEAIALFRSIDLAELMREAGRVANQSRLRKSFPRSSEPETEGNDGAVSNGAAETQPQPLTVSLESLHALPRSKAATVLFAAPVDPTSRLYPFCLMLRDKFIEAGLLHGEGEHKLQTRGEYAESRVQPPSAQEPAKKGLEAGSCQDLVADDEALLDALFSGLAEEKAVAQPPAEEGPEPVQTPEGSVCETESAPPEKLGPYEAALARHPKPRPLLLHATLLNTIYVKSSTRRRVVSKDGKVKRQWPKRTMIDARDLVARYQNYYMDQERRIPRPEPGTTTTSSTTDCPSEKERDEPAETTSDNDITSSPTESSSPNPETQGELDTEQNNEARTNKTKNRLQTPNSNTKHPFIWARDIPLDLVCICEMGAQDLVNRNNSDKRNRIRKRLGQRYVVVAKRSLDFTRSDPASSPKELALSDSEIESEGEGRSSTEQGDVRLG